MMKWLVGGWRAMPKYEKIGTIIMYALGIGMWITIGIMKLLGY